MKRRRSTRSSTARRPWKFRLYVAGQTPRSLTALLNLRRFCTQHLAGRHEIEVIDLMKSPALGADDQIIALPTLVRHWPLPVKRLIGDLSVTSRVQHALDLPNPPAP